MANKKSAPHYSTKEKRQIARSAGFDPKTADRMRGWSDKRFIESIKKKIANNRRNEKTKARRRAFREAGYAPHEYKNWLYRSESFVQEKLSHNPRWIGLGIYNKNGEDIDPLEIQPILARISMTPTRLLEQGIHEMIPQLGQLAGIIGHYDLGVYNSKAEAEKYMTERKKIPVYLGTGYDYRQIVIGLATAIIIIYESFEKLMVLQDIIASLHAIGGEDQKANADRLQYIADNSRVTFKKPKKYD